MGSYIVTILVFITMTALSYVIFNHFSGRHDLTQERLKNIDSFNLAEDLLTQLRKQQDASGNKVEGKLELFLEKINVLHKNEDNSVKQKLMQAGFYRKNSVKLYYGLKLFSALCVFFIALSMFANRLAMKPLQILILLFAANLGYAIPNLILTLKAHKRQRSIALSIPDMLDFLVICVEAGLGLNMALSTVAREIRLNSPEISEEIMIVNQEMKTGINREEALMNLSKRNSIQALRNLVTSINLSDRLGTNITDTLRVQSESLRTHVQQIAEEQAAKTSIKILFPLLIFFLPTIFLIILGPGLIQIFETLSQYSK